MVDFVGIKVIVVMMVVMMGDMMRGMMGHRGVWGWVICKCNGTWHQEYSHLDLEINKELIE